MGVARSDKPHIHITGLIPKHTKPPERSIHLLSFENYFWASESEKTRHFCLVLVASQGLRACLLDLTLSNASILRSSGEQ